MGEASILDRPNFLAMARFFPSKTPPCHPPRNTIYVCVYL